MSDTATTAPLPLVVFGADAARAALHAPGVGAAVRVVGRHQRLHQRDDLDLDVVGVRVGGDPAHQTGRT
ncbi:MAG: hypothetical protein ACOY37_08135 [Pseudomonadota bacterium]